MQDYELHELTDHYGKTDSIESPLVYGNPELCPAPYVSIVIPTFRRPDLLEHALKSALNQDASACSYEVVVVDNEYTGQEASGTKELILAYQHPRLLYYQNAENLGMVGNMNRCIELARGKWVAFLHDDDVLVPEYLNKVIRFINRRKKAGGIMARFDLIDEHFEQDSSSSSPPPSTRARLAAKVKRDKLMRLRQLDSLVMLSNRYGPPTCGSIFTKESLLAMGGFDDSLYPSFDWFFFYHYCKRYRLYRSMEVLGLYRLSVNVSLSDATKAAFIKGRIAFAKMASTHSGTGRLIRTLFEDEQNRYILDNKFTDFQGKEAHAFFEPQELRVRKIRNFLYHKLMGAYWQVRERLPLILG